MDKSFKKLGRSVFKFAGVTSIGHLHDEIIYYHDQNPSGFSFLVQITAFNCHVNRAGITKFKCDNKNQKDSGRSSKMTPSCKWPIGKSFQNH